MPVNKTMKPKKLKTHKWYPTSVKPKWRSDLIVMSDMGYVFQAFYEKGKFKVAHDMRGKIYFDFDFINQESIVKWMNIGKL